MPIYEYQTMKSGKGCFRCERAFEIIQRLEEHPIRRCPECGAEVKKVISRCLGVVVRKPQEENRTVKKIRYYEQAGMWSHAAELADTIAHKTKDKGLKTRAMENYRKAGHNVH
jgi:putative FmdB family regulatory protein